MLAGLEHVRDADGAEVLRRDLATHHARVELRKSRHRVRVLRRHRELLRAALDHGEHVADDHVPATLRRQEQHADAEDVALLRPPELRLDHLLGCQLAAHQGMRDADSDGLLQTVLCVVHGDGGVLCGPGQIADQTVAVGVRYARRVVPAVKCLLARRVRDALGQARVLRVAARHVALLAEVQHAPEVVELLLRVHARGAVAHRPDPILGVEAHAAQQAHRRHGHGARHHRQTVRVHHAAHRRLDGAQQHARALGLPHICRRGHLVDLARQGLHSGHALRGHGHKHGRRPAHRAEQTPQTHQGHQRAQNTQ